MANIWSLFGVGQALGDPSPFECSTSNHKHLTSPLYGEVFAS